MDRFRRLLVIFLCLGIALTGRGPVTELASSWHVHDHALATAPRSSPDAASAHAGYGAPGHRHGAHVHPDAIAHTHSHPGGHADGGNDPGDDSCACGCGMGSCAAMPADLSMHHPELARIDLRIELPTPRYARHEPSPMAPLLRPPIG